jgi:hypothetical protein
MAIEISQAIIIFIAILAIATGILATKNKRPSMGYNPKPPSMPRPDITPVPANFFRPSPPPRIHHVPSTEYLFDALAMIDAKLLKTIILYQVKTGLTREQYDFFTLVLNDNLKHIHMITEQNKEEKTEEKTTKLQWIEKQGDKI